MAVYSPGGCRLFEFGLFYSESSNERKRKVNKQDLTPNTALLLQFHILVSL